MNKSKTTLKSTKGMSTLARPKFAPGMLLQHDDLEQLTFYTRDLSRLMFRSLFGCGVMCGLVVTWDTKCGNLEITVAPGVALSCSGDPIEVPSATTVVVDRNCHPEMGDSIWVKLCGTVKCCAPRTSICESDDDEAKSECTRERAGFEIVAESAWPDCACGCKEPEKVQGNPVSTDNPVVVGAKVGEPKAGRLTAGETTPTVNDCKCADPTNACYKDHYAGICGCHCDNCSDCECKCIVLARLDFNEKANEWTADHSVRRFIRPVLMRDPQVEKEQEEKKGGTEPKPAEPDKPAPTPQQPPTEEPKAGDALEESKAAAEFEAAKPGGKVTKPKKIESS